jgi:hypothetical protein
MIKVVLRSIARNDVVFTSTTFVIDDSYTTSNTFTIIDDSYTNTFIFLPTFAIQVIQAACMIHLSL